MREIRYSNKDRLGNKGMRRTTLLLVLILILGLFSLLPGQFTQDELKLRPQLEEFLKTAAIIGAQEIGEGVTKPLKLLLKNDRYEYAGCWKNPKGKQQGHLEGWQYEIAAYAMDKLLGVHMIPPTVEREYKGKKGSLQFWVESDMSDLERMNQGLRIPREELAHWSKQKYLTRAFDCLIANEDRTQQNIRYKDWRTIIIDHSRSFRSSNKFTKRLMYGQNGIKAKKLIRQLPRKFVERIKTLDYAAIKQAVGEYLTDKEIEAVLQRKVLLLTEIDSMAKIIGEDIFFY